MLYATSSYALRQTFTPKKASQKLGAERKMALHPTFSLYEIHPWQSTILAFKGFSTFLDKISTKIINFVGIISAKW